MIAARSLLAQALIALPLAAFGCHGEREGTSAEPALASTPPPVRPLPRARAKPPRPAPLSSLAAREGRILISAIGDCTLASELRDREAPGSFPHVMKEHDGDAGYPFSGAFTLLARDDLTIANLETTLTNITVPGRRTGHLFRGKPEYAAILKAGSVELVNLANNHSGDFGPEGYRDTVEAIRAAGVSVTGNAFVDRRTIKGIEVVNLGFTGGDPVILPTVVHEIKKVKTERRVVIVSFHWGHEYLHAVSDVQEQLGRAAIDAGADLVLGTHPHVIQGIETYRGRHIVYSLGNFVFGGNSNPPDKDAIIFQQRFMDRGGQIGPAGFRIIPVRISSVVSHNDYRPVILTGEERARVLSRIQRYSEELRRKTDGS
jgi:poly-gamma-glutamate capsule biosynthesis protein CapA/YwtB (metallophosphatase superfamily)